MDLSKIEGLTEEQKASITAAMNKEVEGLVNKNTELLDEKKAMQGSAEEQKQIAEDARLAAVKAEEQRLKANNDMEGLKTHYEEQLAEKTATANEAAEKAQNALLSRDKGSVLNQVSSLIHDDFKDVSQPMLSNMLKISYNDQGEAITSFEHEGKVVANNVEEFKGWASEQATFKKILKGVESSGAGTSQSHSGSAANGEDHAFKQRLKAANLI